MGEIAVNITGYIIELSDKVLLIQWYGGSKLEISKDCILGDWLSLPIGQWFRAYIVFESAISSRVLSCMLTEVIEEPQPYSICQLSLAYNSIPAAKLEQVD